MVPVNTSEETENRDKSPAPALKTKRKDRRKLMKSPAGSTMVSTPGENAHSIGEETISMETTREAIEEAQAPVQLITTIGIRATHSRRTADSNSAATATNSSTCSSTEWF